MKNLLTILLTAWTMKAIGQAVLPASWNFDDPIPNGWTESLDQNPGNTRYTNGFVGAACKLDGDHEYVMVHFSDVCGGVTYNIKGEGSPQTNDIFTIQESPDGNSWSTMRELVGSDLDGASYAEYTDVPMSSSRYVRWYFTEKISGRNVGLDEIILIEQVPTNEQEIRIYSGVDDVVNNTTFVVGNTTTTTFTIENVNLFGGNDLNVSSMTLSGPNAGDFSISGVTSPFAIGPAGTQGFNLQFAAGASGTRLATLTIANDDSNGDESPFVIHLYGIGGDFASEPTSAPTNLSFTNLTTYRYDVSFDDAGVVPENYIVLRGIDNQFMGMPADGQSYTKGDWIDGATQVVHVGQAGTFNPLFNVANTTYFFTVYAFNGPEGFENYYTSSPLDGSITTPENMMGNYYGTLNPSDANFLSDLQSTISNPYNQIFYSNYASVMINKFASRDTTDGQKVVTDVYSGHQHVYEGAFFYSPVGELSREHSWPHSWMETFPDQEGAEYSDMHNLFPVHQNEVNAVRSNLPFGIVVDTTSTYLDAIYGDDIHGNKVYEPRDQHKGDAARAIFYMAAKWNGLDGTWDLPNPISSSLVPYGQDQDVLKQWHWQDPPDNWEIARNDFIESEQGNRNPFVDSVNWVCYIDFSDFSHINNPTEFPCTTTPNSIIEEGFVAFKIYPNPAIDQLIIDVELEASQQLTAVVYDLAGKEVMNETVGQFSGKSRFTLDVESIESGMYTLSLMSNEGRMNQTFVVR